MTLPRWMFLVLFVVLPQTVAAEEKGPPPVRGDTELEGFLAEAAKVGIDLPDLGYTWKDAELQGDAQQGSLAVGNRKVIYYFLHWGPIEVPKITEAYVRERIPKVWPGEELDVKKVSPTKVAGHPALYAEVIPKRAFYRAFFIIWNCDETGRQFIADMNYNVSVKTPRKELQAEIDTTKNTVACHPGAPTTVLESHPVRFESPRYKIQLNHPVHWYVLDNPYGVPHPAYKGFRNDEVGSVLAWVQDMDVQLRFKWQPKPEQPKDKQEAMGVSVDIYRLAVQEALGLEGVDDFSAEEYETLRMGGVPVFKMVGTAVRSKPERKGLDQSPLSRILMLVAKSPKDGRLLIISVQIDFHRENGQFVPPDRSILDTWAVRLSEKLEL